MVKPPTSLYWYFVVPGCSFFWGGGGQVVLSPSQKSHSLVRQAAAKGLGPEGEEGNGQQILMFEAMKKTLVV